MSAEDRDTPTEHKAAIQAFRLIRDKGEATAPELAKFSGMSRQMAAKKLRAMRDAGLIGVKAKRGQAGVVVYGFGADEIEALPRRKPGSRMIAFRTLIEAIRESSTVTDIVEETGVGRRSVQLFLRSARAWRIAYISAWVAPVGSGPWIARWKLGLNADAKQPPGQSRSVINARYWAKRAERVHARRIHEALTLPLAA